MAETQAAPLLAASDEELEARTLRRVRVRLLPFLGLLYFVAYLDRVNVGFASLQMNAAIGLSASAYGLGAGIFFIGYFLFEVPSNLVLQRVGARLWIARIVFFWGLVSVAMMLASGPWSFWSLRFLLGVAEAGFYPGVLGFLLAALASHPLGAFLGLCVVALGAYSATPPFWSLPTGFLRGTAAAAGIAFINSVGNLGGFVGPYLMGWMKDFTGGFQGGLLLLALAPLLAGLSAITLRKR